MQWILGNWVTVLLIGGFIGIHFFMHGRGGHGGHSGGHGRNKRSGDDASLKGKNVTSIPKTVAGKSRNNNRRP